MKIAVLGYSGAGKSTIAKTLGKWYQCPVLHLDTVQFEAGWKERDSKAALEIVEAFMQNSSWVIDGNYAAFYQERRLKEADMILYLNFPRILCFLRALGRRIKNNNKTREDMADGCAEKLDLEFIWWILYKGRTKERVKYYEGIAKAYPQKTVILKNKQQVDQFLLKQKANLGQLEAAHIPRSGYGT